MYVSPYNLVFDLPDRPNEKAIYNPLSRAVDVCSFETIRLLERVQRKPTEVPTALANYLADRGYIYTSQEDEQKLIDSEWKKTQEKMETEPIQFAIGPTYSCNLSCTYCYQKDMDQVYETQIMSDEMLDKASEFIMHKVMEHDMKRPPYVTLFGGEPLMMNERQRKVVEKIVKACKDTGMPLSVVTGGVNLYEYCDLLAQANIVEISLSMDGVADVQDKRRVFHDGSGSFEKVWRGLKEAVRREFPITIRMVADAESIEGLDRFVDAFEEEGWLDLPPERFRLLIQHNGERLLTGIAEEAKSMPDRDPSPGESTPWRRNKLLRIVEERPPAKLEDILLSKMTHEEVYRRYWMERLNHLKALCEIGKSNSRRRQFIRPECQGVRHIADHGMGPPPKFICSAGRGAYALDSYGGIHTCIGGMGEKEARVGSYYQEAKGKDSEILWEQENLDAWNNKNVLTIEKCTTCDVKFACGSGCARMAFPRMSASDPACEPVEDVMQIGFDYYFDDIKEKWLDRAPAEAQA